MDRPTNAVGADIHDVYAHFGLAMYEAQCVERELIILAPLLHGMTPKKNTREELDRLWQEMAQKTLGANIKSLSSTVGLPAGLEDRIEKALKLRNWLAHHYFWERAAQFNTSEGRAMMRSELDAAASFLSDLDADLTALGVKWRTSLGITDEKVQEYLDLMLANPDLDPYAA